jgi:hypothetical protein
MGGKISAKIGANYSNYNILVTLFGIRGKKIFFSTAVINNRYRTLFSYKPDPMPSFIRHTLRSRIQNLSAVGLKQKFLRASEEENIRFLKTQK